MASYIDLLLHPASAVDLAHQILHQLISGNTPTDNVASDNWSLGSSFPPSGSGGGNSSGSGLSTGSGNCFPSGSVSLSGGMDCSTGAGSVGPR